MYHTGFIKNIFKGFIIIIDSINIEKIRKSFCQTNENIEILHETSISFESNKSYAIVGASGSGKSTLLHMIAGIETPTSGSISFNDACLYDLPLQKRIELLQQNIGIVFQQSLLIQELSVLENIMLKQIVQGKITSAHQKRALDLLSSIELASKADSMPHTLSGGQQQRIALLRAIFHVPQFLLADEPTGNLDKISGDQIIKLMFDCQKKYNMGLIISTHDMNIAQQCDYTVKIENKKVIFVS